MTHTIYDRRAPFCKLPRATLKTITYRNYINKKLDEKTGIKPAIEIIKLGRASIGDEIYVSFLPYAIMSVYGGDL